MNDHISIAGLELANVLVTSPPLHQSWDAVRKQKLNRAPDPNAQMALYVTETKHSNTTIISFLTSPVTLHDQQAMVSSSTLKDAYFSSFFEFLCSKNTPSFSVNLLAMKFFGLNFTNLDIWRKKLVESSKSSRIVITGHSFGGVVATLFTLWLLQSLDLSKAKRPLCITFGSPLVGDEQLRKCVLDFSTWSSCFLNVASINDPVPKVFLTSQASGYKPFGTFLLCSSSGGSCFEDPDAILQLLVETSSLCDQNPVPNSGIQLFDYGKILNDLKTKALSRDVFELVEEDRVPLKAGIQTQLAAILGVLSSQSLQQQQLNIEFESLMIKMVTHERKLADQKTKVYSSFLILNESKKVMAKFEWYKKESKDMEIGYYDRYRNQSYSSDITAEEYKKKLFNYWHDTVTEAANKPQTEGAAMRVRFLFAGTNYRRMIEPLHIAEYYKEGGKNYVEERPPHFDFLEQWFKEDEKKEEEKSEREERENPQLRSASKSNTKSKSVASTLNDDSCFWVHVEEALILCDELASNPDAKQKRIEFERYVLDMLENFAVTPDIFLPQSSFMRWWYKYKEIVESSYSSELTDVMKRHTYRSIGIAGLELENVLVTSPPLHQSWDAVQKQKLDTAPDPNAQMALYVTETKHSNTTIISFLTSPVTLQDPQPMISSSTLRDKKFPLFEFLCSKDNPSFSVNELAIEFFKLNCTDLDIWRKNLVESSKSSRIVITGHSFGGAVATLFTLWLLQSLDLSKAKRPLCITFGSPLIGDEKLRQCVLEFSTWSSCFLNVASINDPVPKVFLTSQASGYKPFGTFLLCSSSGGSYLEDADAILQLLVETSSQCVQNPVLNSGTQLFDYGKILNDLKTKALSRDAFKLVEEERVPLKAGIKTQLAAILGVLSSQSLQQQQPHIEFESLIKKMVNHERKLAMQKTKNYSSFLTLNEVKKDMANMEWYKESKDMGIGYYDRYRNKPYASDIRAVEFKKKLFNHWHDKVTEAESKPQKEGAAMRTRFLYAGTNYRRMIEPLHIAEYYKEGGKNYKEDRPRHFVLLEQWYIEEEKKKKEKREREERENPQLRSASKSNSKAKSVATTLNDDSCFWVHVEEALILCNEQASNPDARQKLIEFEHYVLDTLENFAVTPDIFLPQSSFMQWWNKYKGIVGSSYSSELTDVMRRRTYL